jgi:excisionase family DNA binding protein
MTMPEDVLLNVAQVRARLGKVARSYVYKLLNDGKLRGIKVGDVKGIRIYKSSLDKFIKNRERDMAA